MIQFLIIIINRLYISVTYTNTFLFFSLVTCLGIFFLIFKTPVEGNSISADMYYWRTTISLTNYHLYLYLYSAFSIMGPASKWFGLLGDSIKLCVKMSLHQYFVAFTNTVARENAELHVLCMLPGILVLGFSYNLVPRGGDPFGRRRERTRQTTLSRTPCEAYTTHHSLGFRNFTARLWYIV